MKRFFRNTEAFRVFRGTGAFLVCRGTGAYRVFRDTDAFRISRTTKAFRARTRHLVTRRTGFIIVQLEFLFGRFGGMVSRVSASTLRPRSMVAQIFFEIGPFSPLIARIHSFIALPCAARARALP